jgi:hypothetical protein
MTRLKSHFARERHLRRWQEDQARGHEAVKIVAKGEQLRIKLSTW